MSATQNLRTLATFYEVSAAGDVEAARKLCTDDFVWVIPGRSPLAGRHDIGYGLRLLGWLFAQGLRTERLDTLEGSDHCAVLQRNSAQRSGKELDQLALYVFAFKDGLISRMLSFYSDQQALDEFWAEAEPPAHSH